MQRVGLSKVSRCVIELRDNGSGAIFAIWHQHINVGKFGIDSACGSNVLLTVRPDLRMLKVGFLTAALTAVASAVVYLSPLESSLKVAFLPMAVLFIVVLAYSVIMYEALGNTVF